jgi:site-specific DNA-methyltransferase (adenine-specific)
MSSVASCQGDSASNDSTQGLASGSRVAVVVNVATNLPPPLASHDLLTEALRVLQPGGLLFLYGSPAELPGWGEYLLTAPEVVEQVVFKYWIALDLNEQPRDGFLLPTHQGLLLFMKRDPARKTLPPFQIHTNEVRVPHRDCTACGENVKDWGGKKHLINPLGAAPSDVWRDLPRRPLTDDEIPADVLQRIAKLAGVKSEEVLQLMAKSPERAKILGKVAPQASPLAGAADKSFDKLTRVELDRVYAGDCLSFLHRVEVLHPNGLFDLAFADPPYNLEKNYSQWDDAMADQHYLEWCNAWLAGMAATLKPGGSLFVLNMPKWAIYHAAFLNRQLDFRHWIAWDALSDPRGKLMPAHYALLWFTKPGGKPVCNYSPVGSKVREGFAVPPDSSQYCLRAKCVQQRKALGDDVKVELSDVWFDIHRIKHKRDRDAHPCQLPEKLMERIIKLASRPGDVVFDPFCGAGTTAIAAMKLGRKFVVTDLDENYVRITNEKLAAMREHADMFGEFVVPRAATKRQRGDLTKREIESYLQELAQTLGRVPTEEDVLADRPGLLPEIDRIYPNRGAAFKRAKIGLPGERSASGPSLLC